MIRRFGMIAAVSVLVVALAASVAVAASPHFKGRTGPAAKDQGTTLNVTGTLAGLGQQGGTIELRAEGTALITCTNPSGKNDPPGQQPAPVIVSSGEVPIEEGVTKSGNFTFNLTTVEPSTKGVCKDNFTATLDDVQFSSFTIIVKQGGQETTLGPFTGPFTP